MHTIMPTRRSADEAVQMRTGQPSEAELGTARQRERLRRQLVAARCVAACVTLLFLNMTEGTVGARAGVLP